MQKIENARRLAPITMPIPLLERLDRCVALANQADPLQVVSRATLIRIAIQRYVDAIEPELVRGRAAVPLGLPSGTDPTGVLGSRPAASKPAKRSRTRRGKPTRSWGKK